MSGRRGCVGGGARGSVRSTLVTEGKRAPRETGRAQPEPQAEAAAPGGVHLRLGCLTQHGASAAGRPELSG